MMLNPQEWLNEVVEHETWQGVERMPRHRRLCFLVYANGGFGMHGWGYLSFTDGGHQSGLEQEDAMALMQYNAYMTGAADAGVNIFDAFKPYWDAYNAEWSAKEPQAPALSN
jgi:hypothetical protein